LGPHDHHGHTVVASGVSANARLGCIRPAPLSTAAYRLRSAAESWGSWTRMVLCPSWRSFTRSGTFVVWSPDGAVARTQQWRLLLPTPAADSPPLATRSSARTEGLAIHRVLTLIPAPCRLARSVRGCCHVLPRPCPHCLLCAAASSGGGHPAALCLSLGPSITGRRAAPASWEAPCGFP